MNILNLSIVCLLFDYYIRNAKYKFFFFFYVRLFLISYFVKENVIDIGLFVVYINSFFLLLVIDGRIGEISWFFYSRIGFVVVLVFVLGFSGI